MTKGQGKRKPIRGVNRSRRPRTGENKVLPIRLSESEKGRVERAAARAGVSLSRFIVERALEEAERTLSRS
jgi:uncharacterized protein (DUF1778 family)